MLFRLLIIITLSALYTNNTWAQKSGYFFYLHVPSCPGQTVSIGSYLGSTLYREATIGLDAEGKGSYQKARHNGLYTIVFPDSGTYEFMVTQPGNYYIHKEKNQINFSANPSSEAYHNFYDRTLCTGRIIDSLRTLSGNTTGSDLQAERKIRALRKALDSLAYTIAKDYRGTITGDYCRALLAVTIPDNYFPRIGMQHDSARILESLIYYRDHFLENINWANQDLIYTPVIEEKITAFVSKVAPQTPEGFKAAIDTLFSKSTLPAIQEFTAKILIRYLEPGLNDPAREYAFCYLASEYLLNHRIPFNNKPFLDQLRKKAEQREFSIITHEAPRFSLTDENGKSFTLTGYNGITLLLFWDYSCPACARILKDFKNVVNKYDYKNLRIITLYTGSDEAIWKAWTARKLDPSWINLSLAGKTDVMKQYNINLLPSIFVLDTDLTIVNKNLTVKELDDYIFQLPGN